jgi:hypothetical protein
MYVCNSNNELYSKSKDMKKNRIMMTGIFLIVTIGNYFRTAPNGHVRTVEFISIFVIGALSGILIMQIISAIKENKKAK